MIKALIEIGRSVRDLYPILSTEVYYVENQTFFG